MRDQCDSHSRWPRGQALDLSVTIEGLESRNDHGCGGATLRIWESCHSCVTHSRNQKDTGGHQRTRRRTNSSTGGYERERGDTRGHEHMPVRDREAPGSNPGPPTIVQLAESGGPSIKELRDL